MRGIQTVLTTAMARAPITPGIPEKLQKLLVGCILRPNSITLLEYDSKGGRVKGTDQQGQNARVTTISLGAPSVPDSSMAECQGRPSSSRWWWRGKTLTATLSYGWLSS